MKHPMFTLIAICLISGAMHARATNFTVTNTLDVGPGSLRQAIADANATKARDTIRFNIPTSDLGYDSTTGAWTISVLSTLEIRKPVVIDGYTQPGARENTNPVGEGLNTILKVVLHMEKPTGEGGLFVNFFTQDCTIRGLVFNGEAESLLTIGAGPNYVQGNFFGTDAAGKENDGQIPSPFSPNKPALTFGSTTTVGGLLPAQRNLFAGRSLTGIVGGNGGTIQGNLFGTTVVGDAIQPLRVALSLGERNLVGGSLPGARNVIVADGGEYALKCLEGTGPFDNPGANQIESNFIGTDVTGSRALGAGTAGIYLQSDFNFLGGAGDGQGNVIAGNGFGAVRIQGKNNFVFGNRIGLQAHANKPLPNGYGVAIYGNFFEAATENVVGGTQAGEGNVIAYNRGSGVELSRPSDAGSLIGKAQVRGNSIFANGALGIDLNNDGVTENDVGDIDKLGPNALQNFPELTAASFANGKVMIAGNLNSAAYTSYSVDFFADFGSDPSEHGEGRFYLGSTNVVTDADGNVSFETMWNYPGGTRVVSATATDPDSNTSEFSVAISIAGAPAQLLNLSARAHVQSQENVLIAGLITSGNSAQRVLLRALGPSLPVSGSAGVVQNPTLALHDGRGELIVANDNWRETQEAEIVATGIPPSDDRESALLAVLEPDEAYTAIVGLGSNSTAGVALVEAYDLERDSPVRLANISARALVSAEEQQVIAGLIVGNSSSGTRVLVRLLGPSLSAAGIQNPLSDPLLEIRDSNGTLLAANNNWEDTQQAEIVASGLAPANAAESAMAINLPPGSATAIGRGTNDGTGVCSIEIYNLQ